MYKLIVRLRVEVGDKEIYSNFPEELSKIPNDCRRGHLEDTFLEDFCDFKEMTVEERAKSLEDPSLIKLKIDNYEMPSLIIKILKSIQKN